MRDLLAAFDLHYVGFVENDVTSHLEVCCSGMKIVV